MFVKDCSIVFRSIECIEQPASILNEVTKRIALKLILKSLTRKRIRGDVVGKEWYSLCQDLLKTWIHEVSMSILLSRDVQYLGYDGGFA